MKCQPLGINNTESTGSCDETRKMTSERKKITIAKDCMALSRFIAHKVKPHACQLCSKSFPTPGDLKSHIALNPLIHI
ncbi:unnamed protein product [Oppiella nova]|uniref:C2H2-type domain-containing protein n=1 Tax=Oppiella nova TaxID=334625 RepID=A0A7R9L966_9ACAR|nr:unnamed protein product [Oppiella nova]CAG2160461.1 unnamed protein product [Oppiella nova]